ncbi:hypothetical protein CesoFtcFv8_021293 [Champsocephalus esox]|uniref:Uncharacterized protein n=1 Tax=Champsocephalus esox TaxID=159716 RepID=A0AAN8BCL1_9TELE|nr:hypothetical protein CesoFtcFv8_021293 [Champsocephalus esox]
MCLNGEQETSDSLVSIEESSSEETPRCVPFPGSQDRITETPLPNVIQETEPPSSLPSSSPSLLSSQRTLRAPQTPSLSSLKTQQTLLCLWTFLRVLTS